MAEQAAAPFEPVAEQKSDMASTSVGSGFITFAGVLMIMAGALQAFTGVVALFQNEFYVATRNYVLQFDTTVWGWIHLVIGGLVLVAGLAVLYGQKWAAVVGIILAAGSALSSFAFMPYYPLWAMATIALDVFVIWALAVHGRDARQS